VRRIPVAGGLACHVLPAMVDGLHTEARRGRSWVFFFWGMGSRMVDVCEGCGWDGGARVRLHGAYFVPRGFFSGGLGG
jgi:hypothetical protein